MQADQRRQRLPDSLCVSEYCCTLQGNNGSVSGAAVCSFLQFATHSDSSCKLAAAAHYFTSSL